jgi:hypothetical protein
MYGHPFLLEKLLPTDSAPLADCLPYLNLLRELLREHANQILPYPLTISIKPGDLVLLKRSSTLSIGDFGGPALIWSFSQHPWLSSSMGSPSGGTSQGTTRKTEKGYAYVSCSPILKLPPCIILHVCYC